MKINELKYRDLPYTYDSQHGVLWRHGEIPYSTDSLNEANWKPFLSKYFAEDDQGIPVFIYRNHNYNFITNLVQKLIDFLNRHLTPGKVYYHPSLLSMNALPLLDGYSLTKNIKYLNTARKYANKLLEMSEEINDALYFRNTHSWPLHGNKEEVMIPPWYSGMYQGVILSVFVRLYNITKNGKYLKISDNIFKCFKNLKGEKEPWVVYRDNEDNLWIEEYPSEPPCNTLNGFIFGIYGIYDYYLLKKNKESKQILQDTIKTIKHNIHKFRNKGNISYYCLKHKVKISRYHRTHIGQLQQLYKITSDEYFKTMAEKFYNDFH